MAYINNITLPNSSSYDLQDKRIYIYRTVTGTAAVTTSPYYCSRYSVTDDSISAYEDGMVVCIKVPVAGNGTYGTALQINSLGYKPIVYGTNSMVGTRYPVNGVIWAVYNSTQTGSLYLNSASASSVTGCWQVMDYDANTTYSNGTKELLDAGTNTTKRVWQADVLASYVTSYVSGQLSGLAGALLYKGTIGTGGTVTSLPATHAIGDTYVVSTAGTYADKACEVGDMVICNVAGTSANNAHWTIVNGENQVTDNNPTLAWGTKSKVATIDGVDINVTMPSNPNSDTKNTAGSTDTSSKIYLIGATSQAANPQTYSDNEIYATSGVLTTKSVQVGGTSATMQYNSTLQAIEFVFA